MTKHIPLALSIYIAFVFLQSLFFKFAGLFGSPSDVTVYIFNSVGTWMQIIGLVNFGELFSDYGANVIGAFELIASALILRAGTREWGALLALGIMTGAIFFHLFTPLGLFPFTDLDCLKEGCPREYPLFFMAIGVWLSAAYLLVTGRHNLPGFSSKTEETTS